MGAIVSGALRLGLGTVQFGTDYGISNPDGRVTVSEAGRIVELAAASGMRFLDTAALYGESEKTLGELLPRNHDFKIVTKTERFSPDQIADALSRVTDTYRRSLDNLRCDRLYGLLAHDADDLVAEGGEAIFDAMQSLRADGLVQKIGVSVYSGNQIEVLLARYPLDLIQLPINVLDQRLISGGQIEKLKQAGVEIHARSVFLQGLLLMDPEALPPHFETVRDHLRGFHDFCSEHRLTPVEASLDYVVQFKDIDCVVVGVCSRDHLAELLQAASKEKSGLTDWSRFAVVDEDVLNPSRWEGISHAGQTG